MIKSKSKFINPDNFDNQDELLDLDERNNYILPNIISYHRHNSNISIEYWRQSLPIFKWRSEFLYSLEKSRVIIIIGETGSGKSTQLPQYIYEAGWLDDKKMIITQPRRIAAITLAKKVAEEKECVPGDIVGYSVRFEDCRDEDKSRIIFMTEGLLIRELLRDPLLMKYRVIMLDEVHERTVSTDLLLGLLKLVLRKRPNDLRLIISSATVNAEKFIKFYSNLKINKSIDETSSNSIKPEKECVGLCVEGRQFPVDIYYSLDPVPDYLEGCFKAVLDIHTNLPEGDILVFLSGQEEILELCDKLREWSMTNFKARRKNLANLDVMPLFANMPYREQMRVFNYTERCITIGNSNEARRVIVSTNIAETSVTVPGIAYVVDSGFTRTVICMNNKVGVPTLVTVPVSKASADQRAGRAGRLKAGKVFRMYTEESYNNLADYAAPEMVRTELSRTILEMKSLGIDRVVQFPFLSPPPLAHLQQSLETLFALGCLDDQGQLTARGRLMTDLPLHPMAAAMLVAASSPDEHCTQEAATIAAILQVQSIFTSGTGNRRAFEKVQREFACAEGDHITQLNALRCFEREFRNQTRRQEKGFQSKTDTKNNVSSWCGRHFVNKNAAYKALAIRDCLKTILERHGMKWTSAGLDVRPIVRCIIKGFYSQAARLTVSGEYRTVRGDHPLDLHPNSVVSRLTWEVLSGGNKASRQPSWVIFGALIASSDTPGRDCMDSVTVIPAAEDGASPATVLMKLASHYYQIGTERQFLDSHI